MKSLSWLLFLSLGLAGCTVGPKYTQPEITMSDSWTLEDLDKDEISGVDVTVEWWKCFEDPLLTKYIELAATSNYSVLMAEQNIKQARALKMVAASKLFPHFGIDLDASKTYFSSNGPILAGPSLSQGLSPTTGLPFVFQLPQMQSLYNALIDSSWEIDVFGQIRNEVKVTQGLIGAAVASKNDVLVSTFAEIAMNYIELRSAQKLGQLIEHTICLYEKWLAIESARSEAGYSMELDTLNVESQLEIARSELPVNLSKIYQCIYAISVLTGQLPETLFSELSPIQNLPKVPENVAMGLRSDLLRRRPDIVQAEKILQAATANVGVAVAAFFPKFNLSGDIGFQSLKLVNLFTGMSKTWSIGGDISMPLFQGGRLIGNLRITEAQAMAAAQNYHQTVLTALQETQSFVSKFQSDFKSYQDLQSATRKDQQSFEITTEQFLTGYVNLISRIQSEVKLNATSELELSSQRDTLKDLISLYKSLGGGYEPFEE